jgi:DNA-binding MarR family transcriptional regulator
MEPKKTTAMAARQAPPNWTSGELAAIGAACAAFNIRKASRAITRLYASAFEAVQLEPTQFTLLVACSRQDTVTMGALAARLSMDASALARNVAVLQRRGLLRVRSAGEDRRVRNLSITPKGRQTLARALPHWRAIQDRLAGEIGQQQLQLAVNLMKTMTQAGESLLKPATS